MKGQQREPRQAGAGEATRVASPHRGTGMGVVLQGVVVALIVVAVNVLSYRYFWRWDLSRSDEFRLASQTQQILRSLSGEVLITVYNSPTQPSAENLIARDLDGFLRELVFSGKPRIKLDYIDPARQINRAREAAARFNFDPAQPSLIITYDGRHRVLPLASLADFDFSGVAGGDLPRVTAFRGEQMIGSALLGLLHPEERVVYVLQGHGEPQPGAGSAVGLLLEHAARQNVRIEPLNLAGKDAVPGDAAALLVIGPAYDLSEAESEVLMRYWRSKEARIFLLLNPDANTPRLAELARAAGIEPEANRVLRTVQLNFAIGIVRDVAAEFVEGSEITVRLRNVNAYLPGPVQSLAPIEPAPEGIRLQPLIRAAEPYWGEVDHVTDENKGVRYDDGKDRGFPVHIAFAATRGGLSGGGVEIPAAKMIVAGNDRFLYDSFLAGPGGQGGNLDFGISALNWLLDRHRLTGVAPKTPREFAFSLTSEQLSSLALYTMIVMPGAAALLGLVVWLRRRA